jgi:tRNA threonylcarbamoyladenosine biosynthesis protein TsaB
MSLRLLAIDTALHACSACVLESDADEPLAAESLAMERGHAEALLPLVDRVMGQIDGSFRSLDRVAVTVGPGSFTGLRVGISAARAIGLGAPCEVVGVTTLSALMAPLVAAGETRVVAAAIDARNGYVYFQAVVPGGRTVVTPRYVASKEAARMLGAGPVAVTGSGAPIVAAEASVLGMTADVADVAAAPDIVWVARLGLLADPAQALPKPFYLRAPDVRPQTATRLPRQ